MDGAHTVFGELAAGEDVLNDLTITGGGAEPDVIERIESGRE